MSIWLVGGASRPTTEFPVRFFIPLIHGATSDNRPAGYSKRPLSAKLGIKTHTRVAVHNAPDVHGALLGELPAGVILSDALPQTNERFDLIHFFTTNRAEPAAHFATVKGALAQHGKLWISWPKRASKAPTDLDGNIGRAIGLNNGLVDVKVAAIDAVWSGLQFVHRVNDRRQAEPE